MGSVLEEEGDTDGAIQAYEKSLGLQPRFVDAHYRLGMLYAKKSNPKALARLKETVSLAPDFAQAHLFLAILYASMDPPQLESAKKHAQKAISLGYKVDKNFLALIGLRQNGQDKK